MKIGEAYKDVLASYKERGLGGRVGFGERPAVIVVDMIRGFTDVRSPLASNFDSVISAIIRLLATARAAEIPIIFSTTAYDPDLQSAGHWVRKIPSIKLLIEGSEWIEVDERLSRKKSEMVIVKKYASCFFGTDLASRFLARGIDTLIITGCTTSGCVRATTVDSCSYGLRTIIVEEAVGDRAELPHVANLFDIDGKYGDVVSLENVIAYLAQLKGEAVSGLHEGP